MKVLKFGGTSVGSVDSILNLKKIVESNIEPCIVVVSALGGFTDKLIAMVNMAKSGDSSYHNILDESIERHLSMIDAVIGQNKKTSLIIIVNQLLSDLSKKLRQIYLTRVMSVDDMNEVVAYGERISSQIVASLIDGAEWHDSLQFIRTKNKHERNLYSNTLSSTLIKTNFSDFVNRRTPNKVCVAGGFISVDANTGKISNLGRGGSDYTAAILAATLDAEALEIWTDVSGFMTADPRVITKAYPIEHLTYLEATELCNFGAKVVYPPTIYPVCAKNIPIYIKNTFRPEDEGTVIDNKKPARPSRSSIKGISSLSDTSLITISGLSMVGLVGVNQRIFTALASKGINIFFVSQTSSECTMSIGVNEEDTDKAVQALNNEFEKEIGLEAMNPIKAERHLATVAIVGENMRQTHGVAGKLFGTLGRNGINVIACAQGASESNITFVVEGKFLRKSLNVIHDAFFLSEHQVLNLFICGIGTVGSCLLRQIASQIENLKAERHLDLNIVGIANSRHAVFNRKGIDLTKFNEGNEFSIEKLKDYINEQEESDLNRLRKEVIGMNIFNSVFVDCTASEEVASLYDTFLDYSVSIVAANKVAASSTYENYLRLKQKARNKGIKYLFETNVGAGLPIINTINALINSGDKIKKIEAVLSGTINYIFNTISEDIPFSKAVRMAVESGFAESDPRIDLSGKDVVRKLVILSRESGYIINQTDVNKQLFVPNSLFEGDIDHFWNSLPLLDDDFEQQRKLLKANNQRFRFVAKFENGKGSVSLQTVESTHPFYELESSNNIILLTTERYSQYPLLIQGYGAGAAVTAAGVFADIISIANI